MPPDPRDGKGPGATPDPKPQSSTAPADKPTPRVPDVGADAWSQLSLETIAAEIGMKLLGGVPLDGA